MDKILTIDTSNSTITIVGLEIDGKKYFLRERTGNLKSQNLLPLISRILKKCKVSLKELSEIKVNLGPGSFTGLRVGVAVANTLAWALGIPINGKNKPVQPIY